MINNIFNENKPSVLIIRLTSIGDVLLTTPLLRILRNLYPQSRIDFLTTSQMQSVFKHNPNIDNLYTISRKSNFTELSKKRRELSGKDKYDIVIDLQNNVKSRYLRLHLGKKILTFDKRRLYKLKLVYLKKIPSDYALIPDLYIKTAREIGAEPDGKGLEFWLPTDKQTGFYTKFVDKEGKNNKMDIVIAPGAYHFTKRWPKEHFVSLIRLLIDTGYRVSLLGGKEDIRLGEYFESIFKDKITNYIGKTDLSGSAEVIDKHGVVITNDTAIMHIAAARRTPVIALFGSTVRQFGFTPYNAPHKIIEKNIPCRPCTHYGKAHCPKKHFKCMNLITPEEVHTEVTVIKNFID